MTSFDPITTFKQFTWLHAVSVGWSLGMAAGATVLGRWWLATGRPEREQRLATAWGGAMIAINVWSIIYWQLPGQFDLKESLPLQLCDMACMISPLVFLSRWRWPRTLLFFWGIGLSTQAFVTPTVKEGYGHEKYWLFFLVHLAIVGTALYDTIVRRYRPTPKDLRLAIVVSVGMLPPIMLLNHWLGANYWFVGNQLREAPTMVDRLGSWPGRVVTMTAIVIALFSVIWMIAGRRGSGSSQSPAR